MGHGSWVKWVTKIGWVTWVMGHQVMTHDPSVFLKRDAMLARYQLSSCVCLSVCLSVRLSVTSRSCTKMAKFRIRITTPYDSPETLVFRRQKSWRNSHDITPIGGAKQRWGRFLASLCGQYLAISQKRCKIGRQLLWKANRNSCAFYRMVLFSMTLDDP